MPVKPGCSPSIEVLVIDSQESIASEHTRAKSLAIGLPIGLGVGTGTHCVQMVGVEYGGVSR
jgi:hypothetical protein